MVATAAYYRFEVGVIKRSHGHSAVAKAAYHAGEKIRDERLGETFDFRRKTQVYQSEILAPANAPTWVRERGELWNRVERAEKRKDSQVARHFVLSLPKIMTHEEKVAATKSFLQKECVWRGMVADVAWHDFTGKNQHNPHAHVMLSMRVLDGNGFGKKNRDWNDRQLLERWREKWAEHLNLSLAKGGYQERVDHRSYKERGIDREPMVHEGAAHSALRRDEISTHLTAYNDNVRQRNREKEQIAQLEAELAELRRQRERLRRQQSPAERVKSTVLETTAQAMQPFHQPSETVAKQSKASNQNDPQSDKAIAQTKTKGSRPKDPTEYAVRRQLTAMGGDGNFEIGILDAESGKMLNRTWHRDNILSYDSQRQKYPIIAYLKRQNSQGKHIYVRPAPLTNGDTQGLVLIDDLDPIQVEEVKERGFKPACVVETSYRNHQLWLKVANSLNREEATAVAKVLARELKGDVGSASYQHYGRLAGFTNRKPDYADKYTNKFPWVRITEATGASATKIAEPYLARAKERVRAATQQRQEAARQRERLLKRQTTNTECQRALRNFARIRAIARQRYQQYDESRLDWVTLKRLAKRGYSLPALEYALANGSPALDGRKKGHLEDYITRTVEKIANEPDVLAALEQKSRRGSIKKKEPPQQEHKSNNSERKAFYADSTNNQQQRQKQSKAKTSASAPGRGKAQKMIRQEDIPIHALGHLDKQSVSWLVSQSLNSEVAKKRFENARRLADRDTTHWKDRCRAEYLQELGRYLEVKQAQGYTPYTDVEIATKLRMAGFGKQRIYKMLRHNSPFICYLDDDAKTRYLAKGITPLTDNYKVNQKIAQWRQFRVGEALKLPEHQREGYLQEQRLTKLNLALTKERWQEQQQQHQVPMDKHQERER